MAYATCLRCGRETIWRAARGARLAFLRCPHCGGHLRAGRAGRPPAVVRGPLVCCVVCGRPRRDGSRAMKRPAYGFRVPFALPGEHPGPHPAGSPVCWHHTLERCEPAPTGAGAAGRGSPS